jgi:hypothetical protein
MRPTRLRPRLLWITALVVQAAACAPPGTITRLQPQSMGQGPHTTPRSLTAALPQGKQVATDPHLHRTHVYEPPEWDEKTTEVAGLVTSAVILVVHGATWSW